MFVDQVGAIEAEVMVAFVRVEEVATDFSSESQLAGQLELGGGNSYWLRLGDLAGVLIREI